MTQVRGKCLCGQVSCECDDKPVFTTLCHCSDCQRQSASSFSILVAVRKRSLRISGETLRTFDTIGSSGKPVHRKFCGNCGSAIVSDVVSMPRLDFIKAGTLEDTSWLKPTSEAWTESAQLWLSIDSSRTRALSSD